MKSFKIFWNLSKSFGIFQNLLESFRIFWNLSKSFGNFQNISGPFGTFQNLLDPLRFFWNHLEFFCNFQKPSRNVRFSYELETLSKYVFQSYVFVCSERNKACPILWQHFSQNQLECGAPCVHDTTLSTWSETNKELEISRIIPTLWLCCSSIKSQDLLEKHSKSHFFFSISEK